MGNRRSEGNLIVADDGNEDAGGKLTESLARGMRILECFDEGDLRLTNQQIMERTGLPKPTVSRLTFTLLALGYLTYDGGDGSYRLGVGLLKLARPLISRDGLLHLLRPLMKNLAAETNCTVAIGQRFGMSMVYIDVARGTSRVKLDIGVGYSVPIISSSMGRAQLAAMAQGDRDALVRALETDAGRAAEIADAAAQNLRRLGYAQTIGELNPDVNAAAAPLGVPGAEEIVCLMCGGPATILTPELIRDDVGPKLARIARDFPLGSDAGA